jgi:glycosyltransferase involved in cell wall biosynthesis
MIQNEELIQSVSVCIATYNGERFIIEQLDSVLRQIKSTDEIIVVDDCSTDATVSTILKFNDQRIRLISNIANLGVNRSFELAIEMAKKDIIVLADQDDIWIDGRLALILNKLHNRNFTLVSGNSIYIDNNKQETEALIGSLKNIDSNKSFTNLFKIFNGTAPYYGCTMAFSKDLKSLVLPFPRIIESHDLWIAKCAILINRMVHLEEPILYRRIHGSNASVISRKLSSKIYSRIIFFISLIFIVKRVFISQSCKYY